VTGPTGVLRADPVALRTAEPAFDTMASAIAGLLGRLTTALAAEGACWGEDEAGSAFQQGYLPSAISVFEALPPLRDGIAGTGAAVLAVADNVDSAETRTRLRFQ
jgi:hypothetical protein